MVEAVRGCENKVVRWLILLFFLSTSANYAKERLGMQRHYDLEEAKKLWAREPDDNRVFMAASVDINEYPPDIQAIIKEEADKRRAIQSEQSKSNESPKKQNTFLSDLGFDYSSAQTNDLHSAEKLISFGFGAAIFSASVTLIFSVASLFGYDLIGLGASGLLDAIIVFSLAYGIYKKSRICAVIVFFYFVLSKIVLLVEFDGKHTGATIFVAILFGFYFFQGIRGTFAYHRLIKSGYSEKDMAEEEDVVYRKGQYK